MIELVQRLRAFDPEDGADLKMILQVFANPGEVVDHLCAGCGHDVRSAHPG